MVKPNILITPAVRRWLLEKAENELSNAIHDIPRAMRNLQYEMSEVAILKQRKMKNLRANRLPDAKKGLKRAELKRDRLAKVVRDLK